MGFVLKWAGGNCGDDKLWFVARIMSVSPRGRRMSESTFSAHLHEAKVFPTRAAANAMNTWKAGAVEVVDLSTLREDGAALEPCPCCEKGEPCATDMHGGRCCTCCMGTGLS